MNKHPAIPMNKVESSQIHAIGHNPATNTLSIQFKSKSGEGSVYHYSNFTAADFDAFEKAESVGSHFGKHIKPHVTKHPFVKVY